LGKEEAHYTLTVQAPLRFVLAQALNDAAETEAAITVTMVKSFILLGADVLDIMWEVVNV
jgi:hypothetical protein